MSDCSLIKTFIESTNYNTINIIEYNRLRSSNCCNSAHIECDGSSVTGIVFNGLGISGDIGQLVFPSGLTELILTANQFSGQLNALPDSLQTMNIANNAISGSILVFPPNMVSMLVHDNNLSGTLLAFNSALEDFQCANNQFEGHVPDTPDGMLHLGVHLNRFSSIGSLSPSLVTLDVSNNQLSISFSSFPPNLVTCYLARTHITSQLPSLPSSLETLVWSEGIYAGTIPELPASLKTLNIRASQTTGNLPTLPIGLTTLIVSNNRLNGTLPTLPESITSMALNDNDFTGIIRSFPSQLTIIHLQNNQFSDSIPAIPPNVVNFNADNNQFTSMTADMPSSMLTFSVDNNQISGSIGIIPSSIIAFSASNNRLSGEITVNGAQAFFVQDNELTAVYIQSRSWISNLDCDISRNNLNYSDPLVQGYLCLKEPKPLVIATAEISTTEVATTSTIVTTMPVTTIVAGISKTSPITSEFQDYSTTSSVLQSTSTGIANTTTVIPIEGVLPSLVNLNYNSIPRFLLSLIFAVVIMAKLSNKKSRTRTTRSTPLESIRSSNQNIFSFPKS